MIRDWEWGFLRANYPSSHMQKERELQLVNCTQSTRVNVSMPTFVGIPDFQAGRKPFHVPHLQDVVVAAGLAVLLAMEGRKGLQDEASSRSQKLPDVP